MTCNNLLFSFHLNFLLILYASLFNNTEGKINVIFNRFVLNKLSVDIYIVPSRIIGFFFGDEKKIFEH